MQAEIVDLICLRHLLRSTANFSTSVQTRTIIKQIHIHPSIKYCMGKTSWTYSVMTVINPPPVGANPPLPPPTSCAPFHEYCNFLFKTIGDSSSGRWDYGSCISDGWPEYDAHVDFYLKINLKIKTALELQKNVLNRSN